MRQIGSATPHSRAPRRWLTLLAAMAIIVVASSLSGGVAVAAGQAPDTTITSSPASPSSSTSASFAFTSKGGSTFTCKLDTGTAGSCTSPKAYNGLAAGSHTFSVFATWKGTPDPSPATFTWVIDTTVPSTPTGLAATTPTATSVKLTWVASTDNIAIGGYDVWRDGAALASVGAVLTYTDSTVLAGSTHAYQVRARDTAGNVSGLSASVSATTPAAPDTFIDSAPPAGTTSTSANLAFHSDQAGATFTCTLDNTAATACTSPKSYTGLALGVHTFSVGATANGLTDQTPATASWTVTSVAGGAGPALLDANAVDPGHVELAWTAVASATSYTVVRDGVVLRTGAMLSTVDTAIAPGSTHVYAVTATVGGVETGSSPSASVSVPNVLDTQAPTSPGNLAVTSTTSSSVTLGFSASTDDAGVIGYFVKLNGVLYAYSEGSLSINVSFLKASTTYGFDVYALDAAGHFSAPAHVSATTATLGTSDTIAPAAPSLTATPYSSTKIDLSWSKPGDADLAGFLVFQGSQQIADLPANPNVQTRVLPVTGLAASTAYTFSVRSYDTAGNLSAPASRSATTLATNDVRVALGPIVQRVGAASARIVWRTNVAAAGNLTYSTGGSNVTVQDPTPTTDHDILIGPLPSLASVTYTLNYATPVSGSLRTCSTSPATFKLDVAGDMGGESPPERNVANLIAADSADLIASVGDDVYPTGADKDFPAKFLTPYATAIRNSGFITAFGNHEYYDPGAAATRRIFSQPGNESNFSFDCSGVHFSVVDSNQPYVPGTPQYQWLANDLSSTTQPWKVVIQHVPPYSSSVAGVAPGSIGVLDTLYEQYGVNLVLAGHSHNYERSNVINGVTYIVDGGGGNGLNAFSGTQPSWSAYRAAEYSYLRLNISSTGIAGTEVRDDGTTGDTFTIAPYVPGPPETVIASAPTGRTRATDATISFNSVPNGATFTCALDANPASTCTSPVTYTALSDGVHVVSIAGTNPYGTDPTPATASWTVDTSPPVFSDGFETGDLSRWSPTGGLVVESTDVRSGAFAAEGNTTNGGVYAKTTLSRGLTDAYTRVAYKIKSQSGQVNLLRVRTAAGASIGYLYLSPSGLLGFRDDVAATGTLSAFAPGPGWHALELHVGINGTASTVEVWLDGALVSALSSTTDLGTTAVGIFQIGETQTGQTYDVLFDDSAVATARLGPTGDTTAPSTPTNLAATAPTAFSVALGWTASTDDDGIAAYDIYRGGAYIASVGNVTTYTDASVLASTSYSYTVRARDTSNNASAESAPATVTTPAPPTPVFADGFESGDFTGWTTNSGLTIEGTNVHGGSFAAQGIGPTYARESLALPSTNTYTRVAFFVNTWGTQAALIRLRDASNLSIGNLYLSNIGHVGFHVDVAGSTNTVGITTSTVPGPGWHSLELHLAVNGASSTLEVWLDGASVSGLPTTVDLVASGPVAVFQIGDSITSTNDVLFDDAAYGTSRLGPDGDSTPPSVPGSLAATPAAFSVALTWAASTDNVGVGGYDVFRSGTLVAGLGNVTSYTDTTVAASTTYSYTVRARDTSGNPSAQSAPRSVTTLAPPVPIFADGFESGDLSAWTTTGGLVAQTADVRTGTQAAEGNVTAAAAYAKKNLGGTYLDAYARVGFKTKSQSAQVTLLRLRDAAGVGSFGYVYLTTAGKLGFHNDSTGTNTTSATSPGAGWHALELHLGINGASSTVEVWLDGSLVTDLSASGVTLGTTPVDQLQIGDTSNGTYDVIFDDAAFGTARLGPAADGLPSVPANLTATTPSPYTVSLTWDASTDDLGVAGYDLFRDGSPYQSLGNVLTYADAVAESATHTYAVRARDTSGNRSPLTAAVSATTPADNPPSVPTGLAWTAPSGTSVVLTWSASTDDVGVAGYDVYRDGALLVSLGNVLTATDSTVTAGSTHDYAVLARDGHGHSSALTAPVSATTPLDSPPTVPANVAASATTPYAVSVTWDASTDDVGVVDYDLYRDGTLRAGHLTTLSFSDVAVSSGATYAYAVRARDGSGNVSALSSPASVNVPAAPAPLFASGFESGDPAWTTNSLVSTTSPVHGGSAAAEANLTNAAGKSAKKAVTSASDVYGRVWIYIKSQDSASNVTLAGFRSTSLIASINLGTNKRLNVVVPGAATRTSTIAPTQNAWHALEFHFVFGATPSSEVWLDGVLITSLSGPLAGATPTSTNEFQVGDTNTGRTYDIVWDDAAYGTSRLGL